MKRLLLSLLVACAASSLYAQSARTFVSGTGMDIGACPTTAPCRSFAFAFTQTAAGGDIVALDSAGYGPVTLTRAVNVIAPAGILGGVTVTTSSGVGVIVSAGGTDIVRLQGLHMVSSNTFTTAISVNSCARLEVADVDIQGFHNGIVFNGDARGFIDRVKISNFAGTGIFLNGTQSPTSNMKVLVLNSSLVGGNLGADVAGGVLRFNGAGGNWESFLTNTYNYRLNASACTDAYLSSSLIFCGSGTDSRSGSDGGTSCSSP